MRTKKSRRNDQGKKETKNLSKKQDEVIDVKKMKGKSSKQNREGREGENERQRTE